MPNPSFSHGSSTEQAARLASPPRSGNAFANRVPVNNHINNHPPAPLNRPQSRTTGATMPTMGNIVTIPVIMFDTATEQYVRLQKGVIMRHYITLWEEWCGVWHSESLEALKKVIAIAKPNEQSTFEDALLQNMVWAVADIASSFLGPLAVITSKITKAYGTSSGSPANSLSVFSFYDEIVIILDEMKSKMMNDARAFNDLFFQSIVYRYFESIPYSQTFPYYTNLQFDIENINAQDLLLWQQFAPKIPFESRTGAIRNNAITKLTRWLQQFEQQYQAWMARPEVKAKVLQYQNEDNPPTYSPDPEIGWALEYNHLPEYLAKVHKDFPFIYKFD